MFSDEVLNLEMLSDSEFVHRESRPATGDFERLVEMAEPLVREYDDVSSPEWEASPIGWIRQVSSAHKRGKIGEELVAKWARSEGLQVHPPSHRGHDWKLAGMDLEVKTSLRWNNNRFVFLQLRDFDYDAIALLAIEPDRCGLWILPKDVLWAHANVQLRGVSHAGSKWVSFLANSPPAWLDGWGGSFAQAREAITKLGRYRLDRERQIAECESWLDTSSDIDWPWHVSPSAGTRPFPHLVKPTTADPASADPDASTSSSSNDDSPDNDSPDKHQ
jgi:hypothetical protein